MTKLDKSNRELFTRPDDPKDPASPLVPRQPTKVQDAKRREVQDRFLAAFVRRGAIYAAARLVGISTQSHYNWLESDPDYAERWDEAQELHTQYLETKAVKRATVGTPKGVYYKGTRVATERQYSDSLLMFLLRARRDVYRQSMEITGAGGGPLQIQPIRQDALGRLSDSQLDALAAVNGLTLGALKERLLSPPAPSVQPGGGGPEPLDAQVIPNSDGEGE